MLNRLAVNTYLLLRSGCVAKDLEACSNNCWIRSNTKDAPEETGRAIEKNKKEKYKKLRDGLL